MSKRADNPWTKAGAYMGLIFVIPVAGYAGYWLGGYFGGKNGGDFGASLGVAAGFFETYRRKKVSGAAVSSGIIRQSVRHYRQALSAVERLAVV